MPQPVAGGVAHNATGASESELFLTSFVGWWRLQHRLAGAGWVEEADKIAPSVDDTVIDDLALKMQPQFARFALSFETPLYIHSFSSSVWL